MTDVVSISRSVSLVGRNAAVARHRAAQEREKEKIADEKRARERKELAEVAELAKRPLRRAFPGVNFTIDSDGEVVWDAERGPTVAEVEAALEAAGIDRQEPRADVDASVGDA
jgi:hypothetical protein